MSGGVPEAQPHVDHAEPAVPHGRRRESSRHRSSRAGGLPHWLAWTLRSGTPLVSLVPVLVAVVLVQSLSPVAQQVPVDDARFATAGGWALARPDALSGFGSWFDVPAAGWLQLGLLNRLLLGGSLQSVLAAAHGAMLIVTLAAVALVWLGARRAGASGLAAGAATAVFGLAPIAVATHATVSTANVAVPWLLGALILALGPHRPPLRALVSGAAAGMAVLSAPPALIAVPLIGWTWLRPAEVARGEQPAARSRRPALLAALAFVIVLGAAALAMLLLASAPATAATRTADALAVAAAQLAGFPASGAAAAQAWLRRDPLSLLIGVVAVVLAVRARRLRPVVVLAALVAAGSFWPAGRDAVGPVALLLPLFALATAAVIDEAVVALGRPRFVTSVVGAGWLMGVAALLVVAGAVWAADLGGLQRGADQPLSRAQLWVRQTVPAHKLVLVDVAVWPDVSLSSVATVAWYAAPSSGAGPVPSSAPWAGADFVLATPELRASATGEAQAALQRSLAVAQFGSGGDAVQLRAVRRPAPGPPPVSPSPTPSSSGHPAPTPSLTLSSSASASPSTAAERHAADMRKQTGAELARNPRLTLAGPARDSLRVGDVDSRVSIVLGQLASGHRVTVLDFPAFAGEPGGPRRRVLISALDGRRVPADAERKAVLLRYLSGLRGDFATASIDETDAGVLATFAPDPTFVPPS